MTRLRRQDGFTLIEVLAAMALMLLVMGTTFTALQQFEDNTSANSRQNDAQDAARSAIDVLVKQLRNHASPTPQAPVGIERAKADDLIFQTVSGNAQAAPGENTHDVSRVRYCLDDSVPSDEKIWLQTQTWTSATPPAVPSSSACPDAAWGNERVVVQDVVNNYSATRPVWSVDCPAQFSASACAAGTDPELLASIRRLEIDLHIDTDVRRRPQEADLSSAVYFRNQNSAPKAACTVLGQAGRHVLLNGSASSDPEGDRLFYRWFDGSTLIGSTTVAVDYIAPVEEAGQARSFSLRVSDTGGLVATADCGTVQVNP